MMMVSKSQQGGQLREYTLKKEKSRKKLGTDRGATSTLPNNTSWQRHRWKNMEGRLFSIMSNILIFRGYAKI
jgi:hypothetical protein